MQFQVVEIKVRIHFHIGERAFNPLKILYIVV
jgi:hypothetical protein